MDPYQTSPSQQPVNSQPAPVQYPKKRNPIIVVLLVVGLLILLGLLLFGGWQLGKSSQQKVSDKKIEAISNEKTILQEKLNQAGESTDVAGVTYLKIKEWGIRIPLDAKYKDVNYRIRTRLNADFVEIYSPAFIPIATCRDYQGEIGRVERAAAGSVPVASTHVVGIGKTLYMYSPKNETCTTNPAELETPYKASILKQFALLESLPTTTNDNSQNGANADTGNSADTPVSSEPAEPSVSP